MEATPKVLSEVTLHPGFCFIVYFPQNSPGADESPYPLTCMIVAVPAKDSPLYARMGQALLKAMIR